MQGNPGGPGDPGRPGGPLIGADMLAGSPGGPGGPIIDLPGSPGAPCFKYIQYQRRTNLTTIHFNRSCKISKIRYDTTRYTIFS